MNKGWRVLILMVVLLIPSLIFLFLHQFGQNEFDVEIQHKEGLKVDDCPSAMDKPFTVPEIDSLNIVANDYQLVYLDHGQLSKNELNELRRVSQNNPSIDLIILYLTNSEYLIADYKQENWSYFKLKKEDLKELNRCGFGNINNNALVLIDPDQHVRGYYSTERKELDRLEGELIILLE